MIESANAMFTISGSAHVPTQAICDSLQTPPMGRIDCEVSMKEIPLTQGRVALVDDEDYEELSKHKWHAHRMKGGIFYANRWVCRNSTKNTESAMHVFILGRIQGLQIDHINGNGLDNRRENLRHCTCAENHHNRRKYKAKSSEYKDVYFEACNGKYRARIHINNKRIHLGYFLTAIEAARAYDEAAKKIYGEFACLNFGDDTHPCARVYR